LLQIITMKKDKQQSPVKTARKAIQESLVKTLKSIAGQLEKQGIHTDIDFEKESKKLAKKITKGAKFEQPAAAKEMAPAAEAKPAVKEATPAKAKPAAKATAPKAEKVVAPIATPEPPAAAATVAKTVKTTAKKSVPKK